MIGDSLGSLLVYDSLCQGNNSNLEKLSNANSVTSSAMNLDTNSNVKETPNVTSQVEFSITEPSEFETQINETKSQPQRTSTKNENTNYDDFDSQATKSYLSHNNSSFKSMKSHLSTSPNLSTHFEFFTAGEDKLDFDVTTFFALGSPLGTILLSRQISNKIGKF